MAGDRTPLPYPSNLSSALHGQGSNAEIYHHNHLVVDVRLKFRCRLRIQFKCRFGFRSKFRFISCAAIAREGAQPGGDHARERNNRWRERNNRLRERERETERKREREKERARDRERSSVSARGRGQAGHPRSFVGVSQKSIFKRPCQVLAINAHIMAP